jgi:hypothetical protein
MHLVGFHYKNSAHAFKAQCAAERKGRPNVRDISSAAESRVTVSVTLRAAETTVMFMDWLMVGGRPWPTQKCTQ